MKVKVKLSDIINTDTYKPTYVSSNELVGKNFTITKITKYSNRGRDGYLFEIIFDNELRKYRTTADMIVREINDVLSSNKFKLDEPCEIDCKLIKLKIDNSRYCNYKLE